MSSPEYPVSSTASADLHGSEEAPQEQQQQPPSTSDDGLPKSFDVIIVGTGLIESIVSAAVSRNGHTVLHLDPRDYYGGEWATFSLDQWTSANFLQVPEEAKDVETSIGGQTGRIRWKTRIESFEQVWYNDDEGIKSDLMRQKRRFNIDVMPKLLAARDDIVQLLISSNVSKYLEFLRVSGLLTNFPPPNEKVIEMIPLSRADIFTSKSLSLVEKRGLVKLIESVMKQATADDKNPSSPNDEEVHENIPKTFDDVVKACKISEKLQHMVKSSVTVVEDGLSPETFNHEFCDRCRLFLNSIGRYGNQTPFLWTLYGISEICQAFCRLSAVYGGIFILKRSLSKIVSTEEGYTIKTEEDEITAKHLIFGPDVQFESAGCDRTKKEESSICIGRGVIITKNGNIKSPDENTRSKGDGIFMYKISGVEVIEMNHNSQAVPKDYHLLQVSYPIPSPGCEISNVKAYIEKQLSPFLKFKPIPEEPVRPAGGMSSDDSSDKPDEAESNAGAGGDTESSKKEASSKPHVVYGSYFTINYDCNYVNSEVYRSTGSGGDPYLVLGSAVGTSDISKYIAKAESIFRSLYPEEEFLPKAHDGEDNNDEANDTDSGEEETPAENVNGTPGE